MMIALGTWLAAGSALFDGATLTGWRGNPAIWSVKDGAINGASEHDGQLILTDGDYADFRLILTSRLVSATNHLGVCFWGDRRADWGYGECILVIPPTGGMWDYHPGKKGPPREKLPHPDFDPHVWYETEILAHLATGTIRVAVNGVGVTRYKDEDPTRLRKGPIGLQIHAGASEVEYRDLEIEVDPKDDRLMTIKPVPVETGPVSSGTRAQRPPVAFRYLRSSESVERINHVLSSRPLPSVSSDFRNW